MFANHHNRSRIDTDATNAKTLGWISLAIGLAELTATPQVLKALGLKETPIHRGILGVLGVREVLHGVSVLTEPRPTASVWARVAGDMLDNVLLGIAAKKTSRPGSFAAVAASVLVVGMLDMLYAKRLATEEDESAAGWL